MAELAVLSRSASAGVPWIERFGLNGYEAHILVMVSTAAKLIVGEATVLPFASASFDFVYAFHVLKDGESTRFVCYATCR